MNSSNLSFKYIFNISLADIPIQVHCDYAENYRFFQDYLTKEDPVFIVCPNSEQYNAMLVRYNQTDNNEGRAPSLRPDYFLENSLIHEQLAEKLIDHNVLLMHGSALCIDQKAYLFTAKSGTGKSTHAKYWREVFGNRVQMINDDKPLLKIEADKVTVYGTPWNGKHHLGSNTSAELKSIIWLNRGEQNRIKPMSKSDAFPVILSQAYTSADPQKMEKILALEKQLMQTVDFYQLFCNMSPEAAQVAYDGMDRTLSSF